MSFSSFWTSTSGSFLVDGWRSIFAWTWSFRKLYCWNSERIVSNSWKDTLLFKALESSLLTVSRLATASVVISWCFLIFESSFLLATISPDKTRVKHPPAPPRGTAAGRPTTDRVEPKLALENAAERMLEPEAPQLTNFLAHLYFFATSEYWWTSPAKALEISLTFCKRKFWEGPPPLHIEARQAVHLVATDLPKTSRIYRNLI